MTLKDTMPVTMLVGAYAEVITRMILVRIIATIATILSQVVRGLMKIVRWLTWDNDSEEFSPAKELFKEMHGEK